MNSSNPVTFDGYTYDKLSVNLASTSFYNSDGSRDINVAMRIIPTRIDDQGNVVQLDSEAYTLYRGNLSQLQDSNEVTCMNNIVQALQQFIISKGW